jgi:hypothetical protein
VEILLYPQSTKVRQWFWAVIKSWDPEIDYQVPTSSIDNKQAFRLKSFNSKVYKKDADLDALFYTWLLMTGS